MTSWGGNMFKISRVNDMPTTPYQALELGQPEPNRIVQIYPSFNTETFICKLEENK